MYVCMLGSIIIEYYFPWALSQVGVNLHMFKCQSNRTFCGAMYGYAPLDYTCGKRVDL